MQQRCKGRFSDDAPPPSVGGGASSRDESSRVHTRLFERARFRMICLILVIAAILSDIAWLDMLADRSPKTAAPQLGQIIVLHVYGKAAVQPGFYVNTREAWVHYLLVAIYCVSFALILFWKERFPARR